MTRSIAYCALICAVAVVAICAIYNPSILSDQNKFTREFVGHELLGLLGIILTITLASAANLLFSLLTRLRSSIRDEVLLRHAKELNTVLTA